MVRFMMLVGIPGSGKSTVAERLVEAYQAELIATDHLREELTGSETDFSQDARVFKEAKHRIIAALKHQINVVYDATNLTRPDRKKILNILPEGVYRVCYYRKVSFKTAVERNLNRKRVVPIPVIERMYSKLKEPELGEGWDEVIEV